MDLQLIVVTVCVVAPVFSALLIQQHLNHRSQSKMKDSLVLNLEKLLARERTHNVSLMDKLLSKDPMTFHNLQTAASTSLSNSEPTANDLSGSDANEYERYMQEQVKLLGLGEGLDPDDYDAIGA